MDLFVSQDIVVKSYRKKNDSIRQKERNDFQRKTFWKVIFLSGENF